MRPWLALAGLWICSGLRAAPVEVPLERIGFGSCYKPEKQTSLWAEVKRTNPQLWIWLGDNFYNDWVEGKYIRFNEDPEAFDKGYEKLRKSEGMAALHNLMPDHVVATWDDHDYGKNDAGKDYSRKEEARKAFVKFWGIPDHPDGVYSSKDWGPAGKSVRTILLDLRFNRDPLPKKGETSKDGDMLGEAQWLWLKGELSRPGADLVVIGSSTQFVAEAHPYERWANFPKSKSRLLQLIADCGTTGVIFLSGDRHNGEISCQKSSVVGYPIYDITSSGLTEVSSIKQEPNPDRVGNLVNGQNFGLILLNWSGADPKITLELHLADGSVAESTSFLLSQLAPHKP
ncbi:alkaline phosphatase family protein [bacterium]|nr:alkaline phosphatase family protein [bacterium]